MQSTYLLKLHGPCTSMKSSSNWSSAASPPRATDRWEIEVLHRELKSQVGLGQAQVWADKSVPRLHSALVAAYALLKLAAMKAFGPTRTSDYHELPPWRSQKDWTGLRKPSANDLLTRLRADLAAQVHGQPPDGTLHPQATYAAA